MVKDKKQTTNDKTKSAISDWLSQRGNNPLLVVRSSSPNKVASMYAAFCRDGVYVMDYKQRIPGIIESHQYREFSHVEIDHFFVKSIVMFNNWILRIDEQGKTVERVLRTQTDLRVRIIPRPVWRKMVGFRSRTMWKMITSSLAYVILFGWVVSWISGPSQSTSPSPTGTQTPSSTPVSTIDKATQAKQAVDTFNTIQGEYGRDYTLYSGIISGLSNGTVDPVTAYSNLQSLEQQTLQTFSDAEDMSVPSEYSQDKETMVLAVTYLRSSMDELKKYLNDNQVKEMANATDDLKQAQQGYNLVSIQVAATAIKDGYTPPKSK